MSKERSDIEVVSTALLEMKQAEFDFFNDEISAWWAKIRDRVFYWQGWCKENGYHPIDWVWWWSRMNEDRIRFDVGDDNMFKPIWNRYKAEILDF